MSERDTLTTALERQPRDFYDLMGRVIEEQDRRSSRLEETLKESSREHRETIEKLVEGQNKLNNAMEKLGQHIANFEERHANDLARIEERHEENRNRFERMDQNHIALADRLDGYREASSTEFSLIKEHIAAQVERDKNQESRWKAFLTIISGIVITVIGGVVLAFVMAGKSGAV